MHVLWTPLDGIKIEVVTSDVRRAFGRIDVQIKPIHGSGEAWVDSKSVEIID
jgi:hypothetical protein